MWIFGLAGQYVGLNLNKEDAALKDWPAFHSTTAGRPTRPLFDNAWRLLGATPRRAIDLGFGDGTESVVMARAGWSVYAVDAEPSAADRLASLLTPEEHSRVQIVTTRLEDVDLPRTDFLYAGYTLPFCRPERFDELWARILGSLNPRSVLAADLFGDHDSWASDPEMTFVSDSRVAELLGPLNIVTLEVEDASGDSFIGPKHWHVFHIVARSAMLESGEAGSPGNLGDRPRRGRAPGRSRAR